MPLTSTIYQPLKKLSLSALWVCFLFFLALNSSLAQDDKKHEEPDAQGKKTFIITDEYFEDGVKYLMLDENEKALSAFEKSVKVHPTNSAIHYKIAEVLLKLNKPAAAISHAEKAIELYPKNQYYYLLLAQCQEQTKKYDEAAKTYTKLIKKIPSTNEYLFPLANAYLAQNKYDDALKTLKSIEGIYGYTEEISKQRQQIYLRQNKLNLAVTEATKLAQTFPDDPLNTITLASMLGTNKKLTEAIDVLEQLLRKQDVGEAHLLLFELYRNIDQPGKAFGEAIKGFKDPDVGIDNKVFLLSPYLTGSMNPEEANRVDSLCKYLIVAHPTEAKAYAISGDFKSIKGDKPAALSFYVKSTQYSNVPITVYEQIVKLDVELGLSDSLVKHTDKAVESFPNNKVLWFYNATSNYNIKNNTKALKSAKQALALANDEDIQLKEQLFGIIGDMQQQAKNYDKSDEAYEEALKLNPKNQYVLNNYSYYLSVRKEKLKLAREMGKKLVDLNPTEATYQDTYGWILFVSKDYAGAKIWLEKAAKDSKSATVLEHYGDVQAMLGDTNGALDFWKKAKAAEGENSGKLDAKIAAKKYID